MSIKYEIEQRYFLPLLRILFVLYFVSVGYFTYQLSVGQFLFLGVVLAYIGLIALFLPLYIRQLKLSMSFCYRVVSYFIALVFLNVILFLVPEELALGYVATFILSLVIGFDPWLVKSKLRLPLSALVLLSFLVYIIIQQNLKDVEPLERDVHYIGFLLVSFMGMVSYFQRRKTFDYEMGLQLKLQELDQTINSSESAMIVYDGQGEVVRFNQVALNILEVSAEEMYRSNVHSDHWKTLHPDGTPFLMEDYPVYRAFKFDKASRGIILGLQLPLGKRKWLRVQATPYKLSNSQRQIMVSFTEITDIIEANEITSGFYIEGAHGMGVLSSHLQIINCNHALVSKFNVAKEKLIYDYIVTEDILYFEDALSEARQKRIGHCYLRWVGEPGKIINVDVYIYWSQKSNQFFIQVHDVTELRSLYVRQKTIMDALDRTTMLSVVDLEGRIIEGNHKFFQTIGYGPDEILGQTHTFLKSDLNNEELYAKMWTQLRKGQIWTGELANRTKAGHVFWSYSTISPSFDDLGHAVGFIELGQDITALKMAQAQAVQAGKMATLGEMASGVAHEINNPLAVISGRVSLMKKRYGGETDVEKKTMIDLDKIEIQVGRITKIVNGLRTFARSSAKDPKVPNSMRKIVEDSVELVVERYLKSEVQIEVVPFEDIEVSCRQIEISQVLVNLLNNAFDAISNLEVKWIRLSIECDQSKLKIKVTDSGEGIDPEVVDKIMNPFFTTKEIGKGTGLGLSISKGIIEDHGGTIEYNPDSSNTQFVINLPRYNQ